MTSINGTGTTVESPAHSTGLTSFDHDDIRRLRSLIDAHVATGDVAKHVMEHLFRMLGLPGRDCAQDISDNGGPNGDWNVCPFMSRLREQLWDFFHYHPLGRKERFCVVLPSDDRGNYVLRIELNSPPNGLVPGYWRPHFSGANVLLVYPEIVSASLVRSLFLLSEHFRTWHVSVTSTAVSPSFDMLDGDDLIVLATPRSMPLLICNLEAAGDLRTGSDGVTHTQNGEKRQTYSDRAKQSVTGDASDRVRWAVLTRHYYRFQRRLTVLAARNEVAVEAMVQFLTNEEAILPLARALRCGEAFPDHFQALFRMEILKGHSYPREMTVKKVIDLT
jgi:hypothetical protein